jgi:uncharacterized membrane protein
MKSPSAEWCLKRNCSASPKQLAAIYGSLVVVSGGIGLGFSVLGLWVVLPFVGVEILALGAAFLAYGRHAADYERIVLDGQQLSIERMHAGCVSREAFGAPWVKVRRQGRLVPRIVLDVRGRQVEVARYVGPERREAFANELQHALRLAWRGAERTDD